MDNYETLTNIKNEIKIPIKPMQREDATKEIFKYLKRGRKLTGLQALEKFDIMHLPDVVYRLKKYHGDIIEKKMIVTKHTNKRVAEYFIPKMYR